MHLNNIFIYYYILSYYNMITSKIKDWKKDKEKIQLEILNFNSDGSCHAELESKKFKVLGAIPGEIVLAEIIREFPDFSVANVSEIKRYSILAEVGKLPQILLRGWLRKKIRFNMRFPQKRYMDSIDFKCCL